jgi:hypothetical protein
MHTCSNECACLYILYNYIYIHVIYYKTKYCEFNVPVYIYIGPYYTSIYIIGSYIIHNYIIGLYIYALIFLNAPTILFVVNNNPQRLQLGCFFHASWDMGDFFVHKFEKCTPQCRVELWCFLDPYGYIIILLYI